MRNMSFAYTTAQAYTQLKNVTRRLGWWNLKEDDQVQQVVKGMGLKKGEKIEKIHVIRIAKATPEPLCRMLDEPEYGRQEVIREGFPWMSPEQFVDMFCRSHKGCTPDTVVNRIWFYYQDDDAVSCRHCGCNQWRWDAPSKIICAWCNKPYFGILTEVK